MSQNDNSLRKLITIRIIHTSVWIFFNVVIGYLAYAVVTNKIDKWVWIGLSLYCRIFLPGSVY